MLPMWDSDRMAEATTEPLTREDLEAAIAAAEATEPQPDYYEDSPAMRRALGVELRPVEWIGLAVIFGVAVAVTYRLILSTVPS